MKNIFLVDSFVSPPHLVTENKMRFEKVGPLLDFLFLWTMVKIGLVGVTNYTVSSCKRALL